jgi:DnaJ-class molecular chaperone
VQVADLYAVLGVAPDATQAQITHAYRELVRRHHPDLRSDHAGDDTADDASDADLERVLSAYAVLRDPDRRVAYDRIRHPAGTTGATPTRTAPGRRRSPSNAQPPIQAGPIVWQPAPWRGDCSSACTSAVQD